MLQENLEKSIIIDDTPIGLSMEIKDQSINGKLKHTQDKKQASKTTDVVDGIYHEADPIDVSLQMRKKKGGRITGISREAAKHSGKYFFALRLKEPAPEEAAAPPICQDSIKEEETVQE